MSLLFYTEVRVGNHEGDLGELVSKYSSDFIHTPLGRSEVDKYALTRKEDNDLYLLMISQSAIKNEEYSYNMIMTVMGPRQARVLELMQELQKSLGIETQPAPEFLKDLFGAMSIIMSRNLAKNN